MTPRKKPFVYTRARNEYMRGPIFNKDMKQGEYSAAAYNSLKTPYMGHFSGVKAWFYYRMKFNKNR